MLRINLLPPYIYDRQKRTNLMILWGVVLAGVIGIFVFWTIRVSSALNDATLARQDADSKKATYESITGDINKEKSNRAAIEAKQLFVAHALAYNDAWPNTLELMRDLTSKDILLKTMTIDPTVPRINVTGFTTNEETATRWWTDLRYNHTDLVSRVDMVLPPHSYPGAVAATGAFGGGGPGSMGKGPGSNGGPGSMGHGSAGPSMSPMGGSSSGSGSGGRMGAGGGNGQTADVGPAIIEDRVGINFIAAITLKTPFAGGVGLPFWSGGGAAPAAGGGPMGGPRPMGGASGSGGPTG